MWFVTVVDDTGAPRKWREIAPFVWQDVDGGERLASVIREQFPVALIDEFQDTDPVQYSIFDSIYRIEENHLDSGLFLIGDPKQAIYGFRGGDIHTYLKAKQVAQQAPVLDQNFRSRPSVLRALQALYDISVKEIQAMTGYDRVLIYRFEEEGHGQVIAGADAGRYPNLPLVVGKGAEQAASEVLPLIAQRPRLASRVDALVRVDERRWDLRLKDGSLIQLPASNQEAALIQLDALDQRERLLELGFAGPGFLHVLRAHHGPGDFAAGIAHRQQGHFHMA